MRAPSITAIVTAATNGGTASAGRLTAYLVAGSNCGEPGTEDDVEVMGGKEDGLVTVVVVVDVGGGDEVGGGGDEVDDVDGSVGVGTVVDGDVAGSVDVEVIDVVVEGVVLEVELDVPPGSVVVVAGSVVDVVTSG